MGNSQVWMIPHSLVYTGMVRDLTGPLVPLTSQLADEELRIRGYIMTQGYLWLSGRTQHCPLGIPEIPAYLPA